MEIRIGVTQTPKEIELELSDDVAGDDLMKEITASVGKEGAMLWLTDKKGRRVGVPTGKLAYVEIGAPRSDRRVGFSAPVTTIGS
ncbi:MAG: DUF3107 domain-containing protein [Actinomycetota bacterium]|nr:DUF3107 domain-containing protein [Actinomycetota bacterium]